MVLNDFNNIRLEYSVGATVIMFSLIDISANKSILTSTNVSKVIIEYDYNDGIINTYEQGLSFHCNSCIMILTGLQENTDINFRIYISYEENNIELYRIALTNTINEHTLPLGNITYTILETESLQQNVISQLTSTMDNIINYINNLGTYVDDSFDDYAQYAKTIPVKYNETIATADAMYYKYYDDGCWGRVRTSGGSYFKNDVMYHELRHRYGIGGIGTNFSRIDDHNSALFNFVEDKFSILHNALKFESGRDDAKVWIFGAHSNILEGNYTNNGDYNYLAANYIKALAWYTCHNTSDTDNSKIRIIAPIDLTLISSNEPQETYYNITFNTNNCTASISKLSAKAGEVVTISDITPYSGYVYSGTSWDVNVEQIDGGIPNENGIVESLRFTMPNSDVTITCVCILEQQENEYNIVLDARNGTATLSKYTARYGEQITISNITPNEGYELKTLCVMGSSSGQIQTTNNNNPNNLKVYFNMPNEDVIVVITFEEIVPELYQIILHQDHSTGRLNKDSASKDEEIIISNIVPTEGYEILNIFIILNNQTIEGTFENNSFRFIMPDGNCDVYFVYKEITQPTTIVESDNLKTNSDHSNINTKLKTIFLGPYQYLYEYLKNGEDFNDVGCNDKFVILRNFEIVNNIVYDKDIFFIEQSIYDKIINNLSTDLIAYPLYKNGSLFFSNTYGFFATYNISLKDITYKIYNESTLNNENIASDANILCDKLRIYNPVINNNLDFIVYVDNYINNIHFHYYCNLNKNIKKKYTGEIKVNNNRYIEYIEINIPNIKKLFSENNKYFIFEDINKVAFTKNFSLEEFFKNSTKKYDNKLYLSKIIKPFIIDKIKENDKTIYIKTYIDDQYFNYNNNFINTSLNITLYPYKNISNGLYLLHDLINSSSSFISYENYFRLSSRLGFDNGIISLINEFEFPNKIKRDNIQKIKYDNSISEFLNDKTHELENIEDRQVTEYYNTYYLHENLDALEDLREEDEFDEELNVEAIRSTGFVIQFANDLSFNDIILESIINTDNLDNEGQTNNDNFIYDFSFSLNDMVDSWNQLNDILVVRAKFIDKKLNNVIIGNNVVINKEWFKYFINDTLDYNIQFNKTNNLITNNFMDINQGFNFIDNINCTIIEGEKNNNVNMSNNNIINTKLIYKPIFYKVQDLQTIRLRQGMTQNIGINMGEFMNKVNTFILNIGDQTIKESSRNDVFVIFPINANNIEDNSGYYNIMNEDYEYISSGNFIKY